MAVPTLTSITPASGPAIGGNFVTILGSNFRLPSEPTWGEIGEAVATVRVTFGTRVSPHVDVWSATELDAVVPTYEGDANLVAYPPVAITLENMDDDGEPIPGEEVSVDDAYLYTREALRRPSLAEDGPLARIIRKLIRVIKRQVVLDTGIQTHTDFSPDGIFLVTAKTPSLFLTNPVLLPDAQGHENSSLYVEQEDESFLRYPAPTMSTLSMTLIGTSDSELEFLAMMEVARKIARGNPYLEVSADDAVGAIVRLRLVMTSEPAASGLPASNLHQFIATLELRRIPIVYLPPMDKTYPVTEVLLSYGGLQ